MIRVATVHWRDERWIEPQLRFLARHVGDHRVYASLNGIPSSRFAEFHFAADLEGTHPQKLNQLAKVIGADADPQDLLLFLDGDAFPVAPFDASLLGSAPLAAVRRDENMGDPQPHPCFCLTTVGFWAEIGGDWRQGHTWTATTGEQVTDVGGNLLGSLDTAGIAWKPILRTNRVNLHPLWFGIYGDVAYHHGAGFRDPLARLDGLPRLDAVRAARDAARVPKWIPLLGRAERSVRYRAARRQRHRDTKESLKQARKLSDEVFEWIRNDDDFPGRFFRTSSASEEPPIAD